MGTQTTTATHCLRRALWWLGTHRPGVYGVAGMVLEVQLGSTAQTVMMARLQRPRGMRTDLTRPLG
jgi:hypothetical protein